MTTYLVSSGLVRSTFLQGSFRRKTMRKPLHDIDKVVLLSAALEDLRTATGGSARAMDRLEDVLCKRYPKAVFDRSHHALKITPAADRFSFDLVPAFEGEEADEDVYIANTKTDLWERSNTRTLIRVIGERNGACGGKFVHQVRMAKEATAVISSVSGFELPGLHVESVCYEAITQSMSHPAACASYFDIGARLMTSGYTDPTGVDRLSQRLKPGVAAAMARHFAQAGATARNALDVAAAGDAETAQHLWHDLMGPAFPEPPRPGDGEVLATAFNGGSVLGGFITPARVGTQQSPPTRSWLSQE